MLKAPTLPTKSLYVMSHLKGRAYASAGQARAALHTMTVLQQAYQANLLKDLDQVQGLHLFTEKFSCRLFRLVAVQMKNLL